ncbi:phage terminase large subunit family protein [Humidesulfovibrio idahonensis]
MVFTLPASQRPAWMPERYEFRLSGSERKILRTRRRIPCSEWTEKHRIVTMSSLPGRWRNDVTPYLAGIMDASWHPSVRTVIICKAPQVGMSEAVNNCIGYAIDRDPAPTMFVYPDEQTARDNSKARIQPMIESSPALRQYLTGVQDDVASLQINLQHMPIYMAWAGSASRLANKPIGRLVLDEVDKYPPAGKRETDPISLAKKRTITFRWDRKTWMLSTPTVESGPIWQALQKEAQVVFKYWVRCPLCGCWQLMCFDQIKWPEDQRDPETIEAEHLAWYQCEHCDGHWDDSQRDKAVRLGEWRDNSGCEISASLNSRRWQKVGFHVPSWLSSFVSLSAVAAAFLKGLVDKTAMRDFMNAHKAEPWFDYTQPRKHDVVLALRDERPEGVVPFGGRIAGITASADTQDNGWWYEIRAWGYGVEQESWQVRAGYVTTFDALDTVLWEEPITDAEGNIYFVELAVIDSQGHRTSDVYDWARRHRGRVFPFKGEQKMRQPFDFSQLDYYPTHKGKKKQIPGGLQLLRADVNYFKNRLSSLLEINPADPGAWHLLSNCTEHWARMMTVEYEENGLWVCPDHKDNHGWDCSVYNLIAADVRRIKYRPRPEELAVARELPRKSESTSASGGRKLPSWMGRR